MPHTVVEYSANLEQHTDIRALVELVHSTLAETKAFPLEALRTRAARRDMYRVGNGDPGNAFLAIVGRIAPGRPQSVRHALGKTLFDAVEAHLRVVSATIR